MHVSIVADLLLLGADRVQLGGAAWQGVGAQRVSLDKARRLLHALTLRLHPLYITAACARAERARGGAPAACKEPSASPAARTPRTRAHAAERLQRALGERHALWGGQRLEVDPVAEARGVCQRPRHDGGEREGWRARVGRLAVP